jgi:hypothetical protein
MSGASITELLKSPASAVEEERIVRGYVSKNRPAPTELPKVGSKSQWLWVIIPEYSLERPIGPCFWTPLWGKTLPVQGTEVVVAFDNEEHPTVISWVGNFS